MKNQIIIILVFFSTLIYTQEVGSFYKITLKDRQTFEGKVLFEDDKTLTLEISDGIQLQIDKIKIKEFKEIKEIKPLFYKNRRLKTDPNRTRLFFAPTARIQEKGHGFFGVNEVFFPTLSIAPFDFAQISAGASLFPATPIENQLKYISPKVRFYHSNNLHIGAGLTFISTINFHSGITYLISTYDGIPFSLTGAIGFGYDENGFNYNPFVMIGIEHQIYESTKIISENWMHPEIPGVILSFGFRFFGERLAGDFGIFTNTNLIGETFPILPWVGFEYNF